MSARRKIDPGWKWDDDFIMSHGIQIGNALYVSGQVALDPAGNILGKGDMKAHNRRALENVQIVLRSAGASL